jgi:hypothetical protein
MHYAFENNVSFTQDRIHKHWSLMIIHSFRLYINLAHAYPYLAVFQKIFLTTYFSNFQTSYSQFSVCFSPSNLITHVWKRNHTGLSELSKTSAEEIRFLPQ